MKNVIPLWTLRWFIALWVFSGMLIGAGAGMWFSETTFGARETFADSWFFWVGVILYFIVAGTLGRTYLRLVKLLGK